MYTTTKNGIIIPVIPVKVCTQCKQEKDISEFTRRKHRKTPFYSICKSCMRLRSKKWMYQNPTRYLSYLEVRKSFERKLKTCVVCKTPGDVHWHRFDNRRGLYHDKCFYDLCEERRIISPKRLEELRRIAEDMV